MMMNGVLEIAGDPSVEPLAQAERTARPLQLLKTLERIAVALQGIARAQRIEVPAGSSTFPAGVQDHCGTAGSAPAVTTESPSKLETQIAEILDRLKKQEKFARTTEKNVYSVDEVAELTGYKAWTIRQACNRGRIKGKKGDDGRWRVPHDELVRLQEEGLPAE
jgi:hypothetical protein